MWTVWRIEVKKGLLLLLQWLISHIQPTCCMCKYNQDWARTCRKTLKIDCSAGLGCLVWQLDWRKTTFHAGKAAKYAYYHCTLHHHIPRWPASLLREPICSFIVVRWRSKPLNSIHNCRLVLSNHTHNCLLWECSTLSVKAEISTGNVG